MQIKSLPEDINSSEIFENTLSFFEAYSNLLKHKINSLELSIANVLKSNIQSSEIATLLYEKICQDFDSNKVFMECTDYEQCNTANNQFCYYYQQEEGLITFELNFREKKNDKLLEEIFKISNLITNDSDLRFLKSSDYDFLLLIFCISDFGAFNYLIDFFYFSLEASGSFTSEKKIKEFFSNCVINGGKTLLYTTIQSFFIEMFNLYITSSSSSSNKTKTAINKPEKILALLKKPEVELTNIISFKSEDLTTIQFEIYFRNLNAFNTKIYSDFMQISSKFHSHYENIERNDQDSKEIKTVKLFLKIQKDLHTFNLKKIFSTIDDLMSLIIEEGDSSYILWCKQNSTLVIHLAGFILKTVYPKVFIIFIQKFLIQKIES